MTNKARNECPDPNQEKTEGGTEEKKVRKEHNTYSSLRYLLLQSLLQKTQKDEKITYDTSRITMHLIINIDLLQPIQIVTFFVHSK